MISFTLTEEMHGMQIIREGKNDGHPLVTPSSPSTVEWFWWKKIWVKEKVEGI